MKSIHKATHKITFFNHSEYDRPATFYASLRRCELLKERYSRTNTNPHFRTLITENASKKIL